MTVKENDLTKLLSQTITKREYLTELNEDAICLEEELDEAMVGIQERDSVFVALYDIHKIIDIFIGQGLSSEDATDHVYKNIVGAYLGENTPAFYYSFLD